MAKIVSIHSYRGGTGKSNTTANLAAAVALAGNTVAVIDTDLPSPGIHVLFGVEQEELEYTLNDFLWGNCEMSDAACNVTHILNDRGTGNSKIYLIPSSVKLNDISRILREGFNADMLFEGFQDLIKELDIDYLFIDTHPGLNEQTLLSLTISDLVLIVLRPDQQDFQGTAVTVDVARRLNVPELRLLVNKALKDYDFQQIHQQIEKTYNAKVAAILPESEDMIRLASSGLFCLEYPNHPISKSLIDVGQQIMS